MTTDYILFVHGVNVREPSPDNPIYANKLIQAIEQKTNQLLQVKSIPLYWGNVTDEPLKELEQSLRASAVWEKLWFRDFRIEEILPFVGDAALYLSRHFSYLAVEQLKAQTENSLNDFNSGSELSKSRLHLVTHSWGTVILFDILFARRWDEPTIPGHNSVQEIRQKIFGLLPDLDKGIRLASIHTMGSPIALFSLITFIGRDNPGSSHDISPKLKELFRNLNERNLKIYWSNYIHPGDPIAWTLEGVLPGLVGREFTQNVEVKDILTYGTGGLEFFGNLLQGTFLSLINGGSAHNSYWENQEIADRISQIIINSSIN